MVLFQLCLEGIGGRWNRGRAGIRFLAQGLLCEMRWAGKVGVVNVMDRGTEICSKHVFGGIRKGHE